MANQVHSFRASSLIASLVKAVKLFKYTCVLLKRYTSVCYSLEDDDFINIGTTRKNDVVLSSLLRENAFGLCSNSKTHFLVLNENECQMSSDMKVLEWRQIIYASRHFAMIHGHLSDIDDYLNQLEDIGNTLSRCDYCSLEGGEIDHMRPTYDILFNVHVKLKNKFQSYIEEESKESMPSLVQSGYFNMVSRNHNH